MNVLFKKKKKKNKQPRVNQMKYYIYDFKIDKKQQLNRKTTDRGNILVIFDLI